ncbi:MAG TPA: hypothetical protein VGL56_21045 [Fimbriimonadaceae bacterium]|jgi:UDP-2,3-diacylglucosamine pyrophosphatase LpxH
MLVFISDLHMSDGTAGPPNIPAEAFIGTFQEIGARAKSAEAEEVTFIFLGDIYDLIRTTAWFDGCVPKESSPWGTGPTEESALKVIHDVLEKNREVFEDILPNSYVRFGFKTDPRRVFVPGNHDRPCNLYPELRKLTAKTLGLTHFSHKQPLTEEALDERGFAHYYANIAHRTFARHGHEFDSFNFEGSSALRSEVWTDIPEYFFRATPIGDVIACEIASKLPRAVLCNLSTDHALRDAVTRNLKDLFDVRPLGGIVGWLASLVERFHDPEVTNAINVGTRQVVSEFAEIPFVRQWIKRNRSWIRPLAIGNEVEVLIKCLSDFNLSTLEKALPIAQRATALFSGDDYATQASQEFARLDNNPSEPHWKNAFSYVLYGHTHQPTQQAISALDNGDDHMERIYLNTGMWRPSINMGITSGFASWKSLTYSIIYQPGEIAGDHKGTQSSSFETWSGTLRIS